MRLHCFRVGIGFFFAAVAGLFGQEYRATLLGRVLDPSGLAVPGAKVSVTNIDTNIRAVTDANSEGNYTIPFLQPGSYRLRVESAGFKASERSPIELRLDQRARVDVQLELGGTTETVAVTAEAPLLDTASASTGQTLDARRIADLPLPKGVIYHLMALSPGLNRTGTTMSDDNPFDGSIASYAVAGSRDTNLITIDGATSASLIGSGTGAVAFSPPQETVAEMRVQTASFDATQGWTQAANVTLSLKSGTNSPHGSLQYETSRGAWMHNLYFNERDGLPKQDFLYWRLDSALGGPVVIPGVYQGKNKTFFFVGYEKLNQGTVRTQPFTVPAVKHRTGDFSDQLLVGASYQIYNPFSRRSAPNGRFVSDPFAGNIIPQSMISPIANSLLPYWALPNTTGRPDGSQNFNSQHSGQTNYYWAFTTRIDHNFTDRHRLFGSFHRWDRHNIDYDLFQTPATGGAWFVHVRGGALDDVYTFSPTFTMNVRAGYEKYPRTIDSPKPEARNWKYADHGFPAYLDALVPPDIHRMASFGPSGYQGIPAGPVGLTFNVSEIFSYSVNFSKTSGAHSLKFGLEGRTYRENNYAPGTASTGMFSFGTTWTQGPFDNSPASPHGQGLASMLLGLPTGGGMARTDSSADLSRSWAPYFQQDWRVNSRLTLNFGVRWEYEGPTTERFNRTIKDFDVNAALPIAAAVQARYALNPTPEVPPSQFRVQGGLTFAGLGGQSRALWGADKNNVMPRFGFAYSLNRNTVVRGGYGLFYSAGGIRLGNSNQTGFSLTTPLIPSLDGGLSFIATLANPFPNGVQDPPKASQGTMTFVGQGISFFNQKPITPYLQRWQLGIQRQLPGGVLIDALYAGSRGVKLITSRNLNALPNQYLSTSPFRDTARINYLSANLPNPFYPLLPGTSLSGTLVSRQQLLLAYPQFTGINVNTNEGYSWYHSLQVRIERRFAKGFTAQGAYTWSKAMDAIDFLNAADPRPERVISNRDFPHNLTFSGIFELPFGRGRKLLSGSPRSVDLIVGGWNLEAMFRYQSGPALGFGNAIFLGDLKAIPLPADQRTVDRWFNVDAGFERNSALQLGSNLRTLNSRFNGIRGDALNQWDLSAIKRFRVIEGLNAEFRAEFLNAFNQTWLGSVNTTPSNSAFGRVTIENSIPRLMRLGVKVKF